MRRRDFIKFAASVTLASPLAAQAQEAGRTYRIGGMVNASYIFDANGRIVASGLTANANRQQQVAEPNPDDVKCRSFGATFGTQEYIQCRMTLDQNRTQMQALRELQQRQAQERNKQRSLCMVQRGLCLLANSPPGTCPVCQ